MFGIFIVITQKLSSNSHSGKYKDSPPQRKRRLSRCQWTGDGGGDRHRTQHDRIDTSTSHNKLNNRLKLINSPLSLSFRHFDIRQYTSFTSLPMFPMLTLSKIWSLFWTSKDSIQQVQRRIYCLFTIFFQSVNYKGANSSKRNIELGVTVIFWRVKITFLTGLWQSEGVDHLTFAAPNYDWRI